MSTHTLCSKVFFFFFCNSQGYLGFYLDVLKSSQKLKCMLLVVFEYQLIEDLRQTALLLLVSNILWDALT